MKKTKIVATIGPATESKEKLEELLRAGMNVMRVNFSHGDLAEHAKKVTNLRAAMKKTGIQAAILQDLGGPKIRIGDFKEDSIDLIPGKLFTLTTDTIEGDEKRVSIQYKNLPKEVEKGHIIYLYDGKRKLEVVKIKGNDVVCRVIVGGNIKGRRGVNLPDSALSMGSLTKKDVHDLEFGLKYDVDFIALSFVRRPEDIDRLKDILKKRGSGAKIIAKIETPQAIRNIDEIINKADGVMVARGDLAIEVPAEQVPLIQKMIIEKCNNLGKPVITATQMLESMIKNPIPTRAEVSDVANAILDGTDAIMLSEETALGDHPVEAVRMMSKIAREIEKNYPERTVMRSGNNGASDITDSITGSVVKAAYDVGAKVIVALTGSGFTARMISRYKPEPVILALSSNEKTCNQIHLSFGCFPARVKKYKTVNEAVAIVRQRCLAEKVASKGDRVVIACGVPSGKKGVATNMILVETI
ncbi:pyruvate kinase [Candidatus Azambacteria bacterium]|nr:pyruvate kinase [Candidatus Azambacteria bacterium]